MCALGPTGREVWSLNLLSVSRNVSVLNNVFGVHVGPFLVLGDLINFKGDHSTSRECQGTPHER